MIPHPFLPSRVGRRRPGQLTWAQTERANAAVLPVIESSSRRCHADGSGGHDLIALGGDAGEQLAERVGELLHPFAFEHGDDVVVVDASRTGRFQYPIRMLSRDGARHRGEKDATSEVGLSARSSLQRRRADAKGLSVHRVGNGAEHRGRTTTGEAAETYRWQR